MTKTIPVYFPACLERKIDLRKIHKLPVLTIPKPGYAESILILSEEDSHLLHHGSNIFCIVDKDTHEFSEWFLTTGKAWESDVGLRGNERCFLQVGMYCPQD